MIIFESPPKRKKVLVTGANGFIGRHLVKHLTQDNSLEVWAWDKIYSAGYPECYRREYQHLGMGHVLKRTIEFDTIYHLAAMSRIQPSIANPYDTYSTNVVGTQEILDLAKRTGAKVICASSCTAKYSASSNPYSLSKLMMEELVKQYRELYKVNACSVRLFNVFGKGEHSEGPYATVLGIFVKQWLQNKLLTVTGNGNQQRDFVHVSDVVAGLPMCDPSETHLYELGTSLTYSINEIADMFKQEYTQIDRPMGEVDYAVSDDLMWPNGWTPKKMVYQYIEELRTLRRIGREIPTSV